MIGGVVKFFVERGADFFREFGELFGIRVMTQQRGGLGHDFDILEIKCGGGQRDGCELRDPGLVRAKVIPIAQAVVDDLVRRTGTEVGDVMFHRVVVRAEELEVAAEFVLLPRHEDERGAPFRRIAKGIAEMVRVILGAEDGVFRRDVGHETIGELRIGDVIHRLGEELVERKFVAQRGAVQMIFLEPAEFFAMRTIGHQADHVAALRPADEGADAIEQRIGAGEFANRFRSGMHDDAGERFDFRQRAIRHRGRKLHLVVTAAAVKKLGRPGFGAVGGLGVFAPQGTAMARAHGALIDGTVGKNKFGRHQPHGAASGASHGETGNVRGVLAEVIKRVAIRQSADSDGLVDFNFPQRWRGGRQPTQRAAGAFQNGRR